MIAYDNTEDFLFLLNMDTKVISPFHDVSCSWFADMMYLADGTTLIFLCGAYVSATLLQINTVNFQVSSLASYSINNNTYQVPSPETYL